QRSLLMKKYLASIHKDIIDAAVRKLGRVYILLNDNEFSITFLKNQLQLYPMNGYLWEYLAISEYRLQNIKEARIDIEKAKKIYAFYFSYSLEAAFVSIVIYKIVYKETNDYITSLSSSLLYLFSLVTLFITNGQTGIITASLFAVIAYYFLKGQKYLLSGAFL